MTLALPLIKVPKKLHQNFCMKWMLIFYFSVSDTTNLHVLHCWSKLDLCLHLSDKSVWEDRGHCTFSPLPGLFILNQCGAFKEGEEARFKKINYFSSSCLGNTSTVRYLTSIPDKKWIEKKKTNHSCPVNCSLFFFPLTLMLWDYSTANHRFQLWRTLIAHLHWLKSPNAVFQQRGQLNAHSPEVYKPQECMTCWTPFIMRDFN